MRTRHQCEINNANYLLWITVEWKFEFQFFIDNRCMNAETSIMRIQIHSDNSIYFYLWTILKVSKMRGRYRIIKFAQFANIFFEFECQSHVNSALVFLVMCSHVTDIPIRFIQFVLILSEFITSLSWIRLLHSNWNSNYSMRIIENVFALFNSNSN